MNEAPILDSMMRMRREIANVVLLETRNDLLKWLESEIAAGRIKKTLNIEKIIKKIESLKSV